MNTPMLRRLTLSAYLTIAALGAMLFLAFGPAFAATRYGYTWSLLIWLAPNLAMLWWFLASEEYQIHHKRAFFWATLYLLLNGVILDFFFAHQFFTFPNREAVLGIYLPGLSLSEFRVIWEKPFPVEEIFFYFFGFVCILLVYIWGDEYWFAQYQTPNRDVAVKSVLRVLGFHGRAFLLAIAAILLSIAIKAALNPSGYLFPAYLALQILMAFMPAVFLLRAVASFVNWRAFSFTLVATLLISIIYEVTLGVAAQWWGYQREPMLGIFISAWHGLPLEAVTLWFAAVFMTVLVFEAIKLHLTKRAANRE